MKFLPENLVRPHMIPINILYYNPGYNTDGQYAQDILTIVYKDQDTGEKIVYEIPEPPIEIYIVKPEYRTFSHMKDLCPMEECDCYKVKYRSRWAFAMKQLRLNSTEEAKMSPYVYNADIPIETFYLIQFISEYPTDKPKNLSLGKLDIENDIIRWDGDFPGYGEPPINAVTYINMETKDVYTLVLLKDDIPQVSETHPKYEQYNRMREHFYEQVDEIKKHPETMVQACHDRFDELYPGMTYNLLYYEDEAQLMRDLMTIIHQTDNEFIGIWNSPYDMQNIMFRPAKLGMDAEDLIPDSRFSVKLVGFKEDSNPNFHKRKHQCTTYTVPSFEDDMVLYSGINAGRGVLASHKLNYIAEKELKDTKYDYSEVSDIVHLFYDDLRMFILYNIKDVLLLTGIENKTHPMDIIYSRMYQMFVFPQEAFTTTKVVWHSLIKFMYDHGYVPGTNRNRGKKHKTMIDYSAVLGEQLASQMNFDLEGLDFTVEPDFSDTENDDVDEKYDGAFVLNTLHMQPTSINILGTPAKYVHNNVADEDVGSEYPSAINTCNISNETLVAKVFLEDPDAVDVPIPKGFVFRGDDKEKYKMDKGNFLLETYTEGDIFNFANLWLNLPSPDKILSDIRKII